MEWELRQEKSIMDKILFWGAGKKGRYWIGQFKDFGVMPDGIIDNDRDMCGNMFENIMVYSPDCLKDFCVGLIFITCKNESEIRQQLTELGITKDRIVSGKHNILNHLLYYVTMGITPDRNAIRTYNGFSERKILFDLQNGMVLGGVETWTYDLAKWLVQKKHQGVYLTTDMVEPVVIDGTYPAHVLKYKNRKKDVDKIKICVEEIASNLPCTIICNFPQYTFWSACIVKRLFPDLIRIIAVQHNDDQVYYEAYNLWREFIDRCMIISMRIEEKLLLGGMDRDKIRHIVWQVPCNKELERIWSGNNYPLQIGYAGRVTKTQKRIDLLLPLALRLRKRDIDFRINIAGAGNYSQIFYQRIREERLQEYINPMGYIERKDIRGFWIKQDIMISCSEWEGRSISQTEAMASGAVPVITDVSGARDDVVDGYNGYIVPVGDIDGLVDCISHLYCNRNRIECMGMRAHDTIFKRQKNMDQAYFWDKLLKEVWDV